MKNLLLTILLLCGMLLQEGCQTKISVTPISSTLYNAFSFKRGTYWIYRDSLTGQRDSFYVTASAEGNGAAAGQSWALENIIMSISEVNIAPVPVSNNVHHWYYGLEPNDFCLYDHDYDPYQDLIFAPLVNYPYKDPIEGTAGGTESTFSGDPFAILTANNYTLSTGLTFYNVAQIKCNVYYPDTIRDIFYVSPGVGIIKMNLYQTHDSLKHVWELQSSRIVKL